MQKVLSASSRAPSSSMESGTLFLLLLLEVPVLSTKHGLEAAAETRNLLPSPPATEKAGTCPPGKHRDVPPSKRFCLSDAFCPGSEKCCNVGHVRICMQPTTVEAGYCPWVGTPQEEPCLVTCMDDTWCGPGEKCCLNGCHICCVVAEPAKPGICPRNRVSPTGNPCANQCVDDRSCLGDKKCCFTGCGLECVSPQTEPPGICPVDLINPEENLGSEATQCIGGDCRQDSAIANLVKPGSCPLLLRGSLGPCPGLASKNCSRDSDCEEAKKCCWTGCRNVCVVPDEVHPGNCPPRAAENQASQCKTFCIRDNDCHKSQKCCWLSCGRSCIAAVPDVPATKLFGAKDRMELGDRSLTTTEPPHWETKKKPKAASEESQNVSRINAAKLGRYQPPATGCPTGTITYACETDSDCSGTMKCCLDSCSQKCAPPQKG